jgi:DNA-binding beta-propeller fold protein YncE
MRLIPRGVLGAILFAIVNSVSAGLIPGNILVNQYAYNRILEYTPAGVLVQTYTGFGKFWEGAAVAPGGKLVTTYRLTDVPGQQGGFDIFNAAGVQVTTINTGIQFSGQVSVFADGTLAIPDQSVHVAHYSQTGSFLGDFFSGGTQTFGSTISPKDGSLWVSDVGSPSGKIFNVTESGTVLHSFVTHIPYQGTDFALPSGIAVDPIDGTLWVGNMLTNSLYHLTANGSTIGALSLLDAPEGVALGLDGTLWTCNEHSTTIYHYSKSGARLGSFTVPSNSNLFVTVVPVPEPTGAALFSIGLGAIALHRRRR